MTTLREYIAKIRSEGCRCFTVIQAVQDLGVSKNAVILKCKRLRDKGELLAPVKGLYVMVPPEHRTMGSPPLEELIPLVMKYLNVNYYVCLLTAALYHGASHQKPQVFQVMLDSRLRAIYAGKMLVQIIYKKSLNSLPWENKESRTGYLRVASPELTVMDLLLYPKHCGGLNHIATVLAELIEEIDPQKLVQLASFVKQKIWLQRLGYILEHLEPSEQQQRVATVLKEYLVRPNMSYVPLAPEAPAVGCPRDKQWKIIVNATVEADE